MPTKPVTTIIMPRTAKSPRKRLTSEPPGPQANTYLAIYFTLTGLHALHVIAGALVIAYFWGHGSKMWNIQNSLPIESRFRASSGTSWIWCGSFFSQSFTSFDPITI